MNLDQALAEIVAYSVTNGIDSLTAVERMVKNYNQLGAEQQQAVTVFMAETKMELA